MKKTTDNNKSDGIEEWIENNKVIFQHTIKDLQVIKGITGEEEKNGALELLIAQIEYDIRAGRYAENEE
jgi:hypothetical protein